MKNPHGYLIACIVEYFILSFDYFVIACLVSLSCGAFWFAISATKEFQRIAPMINAKGKAKRNAQQSHELKMLLAELTDAHGIVKQLSTSIY